MTVVSAVHLVVLLSRLAHFCAELKHNFHDQTVPCALLINQFSMNDDFAVPPSHNYVLAITFSWLRLLFWALSVAVMTARCFKGTDFELVDASTCVSSTASYNINNNNNIYSGTSRPSRALLNGYTTTSESGGEEATTTAELPAKSAMNRVHRVRLTSAAKSSTDDDDDEYATDDGTLLAADDEYGASNAGGGSGGAVHVNGVEFRPSAQMLLRSGVRTHPAIAEEEDAEHLMAAVESTVPTKGSMKTRSAAAAATRLQQLGGSNCRRLVNEIDLVRETKPKRLKKYLDSKA